jgi:hypothetical protein
MTKTGFLSGKKKGSFNAKIGLSFQIWFIIHTILMKSKAKAQYGWVCNSHIATMQD